MIDLLLEPKQLLYIRIEALFFLAFGLVGLVMAVKAIIHNARMRPDAYDVVGRISKGAWLAINIGSLIAMLVMLEGLSVFGFFFAIIGYVAVGVYLVDVKPKTNDVARGASAW